MGLGLNRKPVVSYGKNMFRSVVCVSGCLLALTACGVSEGSPNSSAPEMLADVTIESSLSSKVEAACTEIHSGDGVEGTFSFAVNLHESLPEEWTAEFMKIMRDMACMAPISKNILDISEVPRMMNVYAWLDSVSNPFPDKEGVSGTCICGDGSDMWMALEMGEEGFRPENLHIHRYQVIVHEYFHVHQISRSGNQPEPIWLTEGGAQAVENLYSQDRYGESAFEDALFPITANWVDDPSPLEQYEYTEADRNYQFSTFMTLALAKEVQARMGISEVEALRLVLVDFLDAKFVTPDWKDAFVETFEMTVEDFYDTLSEFPISESTEAWYSGRVVDAQSVMPSEDIRLEEIFS